MYNMQRLLESVDELRARERRSHVDTVYHDKSLIWWVTKAVCNVEGRERVEQAVNSVRRSKCTNLQDTSALDVRALLGEAREVMG